MPTAMVAPPPRESPGLRERKRESLRAAIQNAALTLFSRNGFETTTVEQVAAEVGISARTVHRYFPHKRDLVTYDRFNPTLRQRYRSQPPLMRPIQAVREALRDILGESALDGHASGRARLSLLLNGSLSIGGIADYVDTQRFMADLVSERMPGRNATQVRVVAAALTGTITMIAADWLDDPDMDAGAALDEALALLAASGLDG